MNIGISLFSAQQPLDPAVVAQQAEALGFDSLWMGEHPVMPVHSTAPAPGTSGGSIPDFYSRLVDPFVALARAVLNELAVEAGRDPAAITVLAYIVPADRALLHALAEAGADAAVVRLEADSEAAALAQLDQLAQQVL